MVINVKEIDAAQDYEALSALLVDLETLARYTQARRDLVRAEVKGLPTAEYQRHVNDARLLVRDTVTFNDRTP